MNRAEGTLVHGRWLVRDWSLPGCRALLENGAVYQEGGVIVAVDDYGALRRRFPAANEIGDSESIVIPGLVNAHSHGRGVSTFQKGQPDEPLELRLLESIHRSTHDGQRFDPYCDTLYSCMKQIASGITTTVHSHSYYQGSIEGYAHGVHALLRAYRESGMRCAFALGIRDRNRFAYLDDDAFLEALPDARRAAGAALGPGTYVPFDEYLALLEELVREMPEVRFQLGPTNPVWCSERLLGNIADASRNHGWRVHTHLAETRYQARFARDTYGKSWAELLDEIGMLTDRFSCAHGVWLDDRELRQFAEAGAQIVHNPGSNLRLSSGIAPLRLFLERGVRLAIGTDSLSMNDDEDLLQDIRLAGLLQNVPGMESEPLDPAVLFTMATRGGATVAGMPDLGVIAENAPADVVLLSLSAMSGLPGSSPLPLAQWLLHRGKGSHVRTVMINGKIVLQDGAWTTLDPGEIVGNLQMGAASKPVADEAPIRDLKASVRAYYRSAAPASMRTYVYNDS